MSTLSSKTRAPQGRRKICVVTGSRAEYGLLKPLLLQIRADQDLELLVVATGMHFSNEHGLTYRTIEEDGFTLAARVETQVSSDTGVGLAKSLGLGVIGFADCLQTLRPDVLVVLGDRYEIFAAVQAALALRIPVAHLHGGEVTEGAIDEAMRHAISKMSHLHFVAAQPYGDRLRKMGEKPDTIHCVGAIGFDSLKSLPLLSRSDLESKLGLKLKAPTLLATFHPATLDPEGTLFALQNLLKLFDSRPDLQIIFTRPNADMDSRALLKGVEAFVEKHSERAAIFTSLGQVNYLSLMRESQLVVGNSSSGLYEAPYFGVPTLDIGARQKGRLRAKSVLHSDGDLDSLQEALVKALSPEFKKSFEKSELPYGGGNVAESIKEVLKQADLEGFRTKAFHDV